VDLAFNSRRFHIYRAKKEAIVLGNKLRSFGVCLSDFNPLTANRHSGSSNLFAEAFSSVLYFFAKD